MRHSASSPATVTIVSQSVPNSILKDSLQHKAMSEKPINLKVCFGKINNKNKNRSSRVLVCAHMRFYIKTIIFSRFLYMQNCLVKFFHKTEQNILKNPEICFLKMQI